MKALKLDEMYRVNGGDNAYEGNSDPLSGKIVSSDGGTMDAINFVYDTIGYAGAQVVKTKTFRAVTKPIVDWIFN